MRPRFLLPLLTYPDASPVGALRRALDLAATLNAEVTALVHEVDIPPITEPFANFVLDVKAMSVAAERLSRARGEELAQAVRHQAERTALPLMVETFRRDRLSGEVIASRARTYDLTILLSQAGSPDYALLEEEVLFRSGGPVVVLPSENGSVNLNTVAVAWDGSRAAARALRDALGVLREAGRIVILTADHEKPIQADSVSEVLAFLEAHEIAAQHRAAPAAGAAAIGDVLQRAALDEDAGLLVMGAYGHSRMREFVLGGATKSVLRSPRLPLLMSH
jgi:nucleotide-binding universal stress UspA family protein